MPRNHPQRFAAGSAAENNAAASASKDELLSPIRDAAWEEIRSEKFATFAVRAKRSYKGFPVNAMAIEREVGGYLFDKLRAEGREIRVRLNHPELTCRIEVTPGPALIYARRHPGAGRGNAGRPGPASPRHGRLRPGRDQQSRGPLCQRAGPAHVGDDVSRRGSARAQFVDDCGGNLEPHGGTGEP